MKNRRRLRGFERAGSLPVGELGIPAGKARDLVLAEAWARIAGPAIARRARACGVSRGILEIDLDPGPWTDAVRDLLPTLTSRLAAARPDLKIRKFRTKGSDAMRFSRS